MIWITLIVTIGAIVVITRWCDYRTDVARAKYQNRRYVYCCTHAATAFGDEESGKGDIADTA